MQVEWPVLQHMLEAGKGNLLTAPGGGVEALYLNETDPNKTVDGQRSSLKAPHPFLTDPKVRQALALAADRTTMATQLYGATGDASPNILTTPRRYYSKATKLVFDIDQASRLLDEAGWKRGPDGVREKNGIKMEMTYVTSVNSLRQKEQQIVKEGWEKAGARVTLQSVDAGVFFASSPGNNDTLAHFYRDVEMYTGTFGIAPVSYMSRFYSGDPAVDIAQKENNWSGRNTIRWINKEYNALYEEGLKELEAEKNAAIWMKANDVVVNQGATIPLIDRKNVSVKSKTLDTANNMTPFDSETCTIADWRRTS